MNAKSEAPEEFDVVVVGGGPGGSTLASLVALQGHRVLILEKESFPRYQIGESLLPSTIHGVCRLIGVTERLAEAGFTLKRGGTFRWGSNEAPWTFSFSVSPKISGPTSFAYQVERMKFDQILLDNARAKGAVVREQCAVTGIKSEADRVTGVVYSDASGAQHEVRSKYVADASGNRSSIYKHVGGTRRYSEFFRSLAVFGYYAGGKRLPHPNSGNILSAAFPGGWFWYIPLSDTLTSVGAVVHRDLAARVQGNPERALEELVDECPLVRESLAGVDRVRTGHYGTVRVRKDYSYYNSAFWRPGMACIGDAACFVDPVFSSGVHLATYSALLAARAINSVLAGLVDEESAFNEFEARYRREYSVFYEFLMSFYDLHADENSYFWQAKKVTKSSNAELESFVDLVAGISSSDFGMNDAESAVLRFKSRSDEFVTAIEELRGDSEQNMAPLFKSSVVKQAMQESAAIQTRALLGDDAGIDIPLFPGGLVPSPDGMFWLRPA